MRPGRELTSDELSRELQLAIDDDLDLDVIETYWLKLDAACKAGNLPSAYCTWEGLLTILDTVYPESVFPTTWKKDEPYRDPGPRIVALIRWVAKLEAERDELRKTIDKANRDMVNAMDEITPPEKKKS